MKKLISMVVVFSAIMLFTGCSGSVTNMQVLSQTQVVSAPEKDKAMVVFMRPSSMGYAVQSSVFEMKKGTPTLAGIVAAKKKVAYQLDAGEHLFMVIGESADFMSATLEANKTYYVLVTPRMGVWKARFSLKPISKEQFSTSEFNEWLNDCEWVGKTQASENWMSENMADISAKYTEYYADWMSKNESERPKLLMQDGR